MTRLQPVSQSCALSCALQPSNLRLLFVLMALLVSAGPGAAYLHAQSGAHPAALELARDPGSPKLTLPQAPLAFEPNLGQDASDASYISFGPGYEVRLGASRAEFVLSGAKKTGAGAATAQSLGLRFLGSDPHALVRPLEDLPGTHSYLPASDPTRWVTAVPMYGRVEYSRIYRGIDLAFYGNAGRLEYDFSLKPRADARTIRLATEGVGTVSMETNGSLTLSSHGHALTLLKPRAYQIKGADKTFVDVSYTVEPQDSRRHQGTVIGFRLGSYDRTKALVIDPVLIYGLDIPGAAGYSSSSYYFSDTNLTAMTADIHGNAYVVAEIESSHANFSVLKFDPTGKLLFNVSIGSASSTAVPTDIAVDSTGNIYLSGSAYLGYPTTAGAFQATSSNQQAAFLTVIKADASGLLYSTFMGTSSTGSSVAVDAAGAAYLAGSMYYGSVFTTPGAYQTYPTPQSDNAFVAKFNPLRSGAASLIYSTLLSASSVTSIAVDKSGDAFVSVSASQGYPVTKGAYNFDGNSNGGAYVTKLNPTGSALLYSAYLGPGNPSHLAIDGSGEAYVVGAVTSQEFPTTTGAYKSQYAGGFASKVSSDGSTLLYSTFLGGPSSYQSGTVTPSSIALLPGCASNCAAYIAGTTSTTDFPLINPIQSFLGSFTQYSEYSLGISSGFLVNLAADGKSALSSTYLGGATSATYSSPAIGADSAGNIYFSSNIQGPDAPVTSAAVQNPGAGFLAKIGPANAGATVLVPSSLAFGSQAVHSTSSQAAVIELRNMGSQKITLQRPFVFSSSEFTESDNCGTTLTGGGLCTLNVRFTPAASGTRSGTLSIASTASNSPSRISLSGVAFDGPNLVLSRLSAVFGDQVVKTTSVGQILTISNTGDQPQAILGIGTSLPDYTTISTCKAALNPGTSCQVTIRFSPTQIGLRSDYITVQIPGGYYYPTVTLSGTGVLAAAGTGTVQFSESAVNFGSIAVGLTAGTQTISLMNTGTTPVTINGIAVSTKTSGAGAADFSMEPLPSPYSQGACGYQYSATTPTFPYQLSPQTGCSITVSFTPSLASQETGTIAVSDSATGSPQSLSLSGIGQHSVLPLIIDPSNMAFPSQPIGDESGAQSFTIANMGEDVAIIERAYTTGDFAVVDTGSTCEGAKLDPLESCQLNVIFNPTAVGARTGTLNLVDSLSSTVQQFNLTGTGIQATGALVLSQSTLAFPAQARGTTSLGQAIYLSNPGNSPVQINALSTSGDFAISSALQYNNTICGSDLAPASTCEIQVAFSPTQASGTESGTLIVHSSVGNLSVALSGTSLATTTALHLSPVAVGFGGVKIGTVASQVNGITVYIDNTGTQPITFPTLPRITASGSTPAGDFSVSSGSCYEYLPYSNNLATPPALPAGQSCTMLVAFAPTILGAEKATLQLTDSAGTQTVALSGTSVAAAPAVTLQPTVLAFPQQPNGTAAINDYNFEVYLYNNTPQALKISSVAVTAGSSDFSVSSEYSSCANVALSANTSCTTVFTFHPSALGYRTGTATFKDSTGKIYTAALAGYSSADTHGALLTPQDIILPASSLLTPHYTSYQAPTYAVLTNTGNTPLKIGTISGTNLSSTSDFSLVGSCSGVTIAPGTSCNTGVIFQPKAIGARTGTMNFPITYFDKSTATITAKLSGQGLPNTDNANLLPQNVIFATQVAGTGLNYQNQQKVVLTNSGTVPLTVGTLAGTDLAATAGGAGDFLLSYDNCSKAIVLPGGSCNASFYFQPATAGKKTGSVKLPVTYADGKTAALTAVLTGTASAPSPALILSTLSLLFNVEIAGTSDSSNTQTVYLSSAGSSSVTIRSVTASANFSVTSNNCSPAITAGSWCGVTVAFSPLATTAAGTANGTLTIVDNAPGSPHIVKLSGTVLGTSQPLALSQSLLSFGNQTVGTAGAPQVVYLLYRGSNGNGYSGTSSTIQINSIRVTGANPADFIETQTCGGALGFSMSGRSTCTISVAFAPGKLSTGTRNANVTITPAKGSPLVIQLSGTGIAAGPAVSRFPVSPTGALP